MLKYLPFTFLMLLPHSPESQPDREAPEALYQTAHFDYSYIDPYDPWRLYCDDDAIPAYVYLVVYAEGDYQYFDPDACDSDSAKEDRKVGRN